jgi:RHS repeat-associated protein
MVYDYDGHLVQKNVGGQVTRYVYAGGPAPVEEINVTAGTTKDFIQANGRTWGVMEATSNTYFHHDAIGSVVALSNDSGQVTDTYEYEPFGKVLEHQGRSQNDYQFVGGYGVRKLNDTLDTMGVRQYSEATGRFTTQDPIGLRAGDLNFYRYSRNNPAKIIDPTGLWIWFGNYGGPDWTGGKNESYDPGHQNNYLPPADAQDACYQQHDMCYYACRQNFCGCDGRKTCFKVCDRQLSKRLFGLVGTPAWDSNANAAAIYFSMSQPGCN